MTRSLLNWKKTHTWNSTVFMFRFNDYLWPIFLIKFWNFLILHLGCSCMTFNFTTHMTLHHLIPPCPWIKTNKQRQPSRDVLRKRTSENMQQIYSIPSSFWSFIVSCCSITLLLLNIITSEGLVRYSTSIFS